MSNEGYHEPIELLSTATKDLHRAIISLMEELEAVDWYNQRVDATDDAELKGVLAHNRDEEIEHAAMTLEWIRRRHPVFDRELRDFLFTDKPLGHAAHSDAVGADAKPDHTQATGAAETPTLTVASLKKPRD